jgi:hypothetical protein
MTLIIRNADGSTEGADPRTIERSDLPHEPAPILKVVRAKCLDCSAGSQSEVAKCTAIRCALWPYRMGSNPFSDRKGNPEALARAREAKRSAKPLASTGKNEKTEGGRHHPTGPLEKKAPVIAGEKEAASSLSPRMQTFAAN